MLKGFLAFILGFAFISCGEGEQAQSDVFLEIIPTKAIVVPADQKSCIDLAENPTNFSVSSPSVSFNNLRLTYISVDKDLYIAQIKITINNQNLSGGKYKSSITTDELDKLLGISSGRVEKATTADDGSILPVVLDSTQGKLVQPSDPNSPVYTAKPNGAQPCGPRFGGINSVIEDKDFTATGTLELIGYTIDADGNQDVISTKTTLQIQVKN